MSSRVPPLHGWQGPKTISHMKQKAYAAAGVDIDLGNKVKGTLPKLLASTHRREVLGKVVARSREFGGVSELEVVEQAEPIL